MSRPRRRVVWAVVGAAAGLAGWTILGLMARQIVPGSAALTNRLFALALPLTYAGCWALLILASRRPRGILVCGVVVTLTLILVLLILEIPASLRWVHWDVVFRRLNGEAADYGTAYVHDAELSFRRIPDLTWTTRPIGDIEQGFSLPPAAEERITFTYDRWGYRNVEEMEQAEVVLLGDSYVEGWYVSDEQTVAAHLAARLGRPVANLGVGGYGTLQALRVLESDALARQPRVVVWFFFEGNDLYDDHTFENFRLAEPPSAAETVPHPEGLAAEHGWKERSFARNALRRLRRWSHPLIPNRAPYWALLPGKSGARARIYFADYAASRWRKFEAERWRAARGAFEEGLGFAETHGFGLVFVYIPIKYRIYRHAIEVPADSPMRTWNPWTELPELFHAFCTSARATCLDLTAPFERAVRRGTMVYARTDTHWSAQGHVLVAAELEPVLRGMAHD